MNLTVLTVKQLNTYVKSLLEGDVKLASICVSGEISNMRIYSSGHLYFSLRESDALIKCVMFAFNVNRLNFMPKEGMRVIVRGKVTLYEKDGSYQLMCETIVEDGVGDVSLKFKLIKDKLENEGLFLEEHKKQLPEFPQKIAVVTSRDGAALHDILNVINRRYPICEIVLFSSLVQGLEAPKSIIKSLELADNYNADLIIVGRGGGSKEDLEAFNDELLARTVFGLKTPVISAVGHETDFTIIDYVSDLRAPTPSAAAEIAVPNIEEIKQLINTFNKKLLSVTNIYLNNYDTKVTEISQKDVFANPKKLYESFENKLEVQQKLTINAFNNLIMNNENRIKLLASRINDLNPLNVLTRGYSLVYNNDVLVNDANQINENDRLTIQTANSSISLTATNIIKGE